MTHIKETLLEAKKEITPYSEKIITEKNRYIKRINIEVDLLPIGTDKPRYKVKKAVIEFSDFISSEKRDLHPKMILPSDNQTFQFLI